MGLAARVGTFTEPATTGVHSVTVAGLGVAPKLVLLWGEHRPSGGSVDFAIMHFGAMTGTGQEFGLYSVSNGGVTTSQTTRSHAAKAIYTKAGVVDQMEAAFSSFGTSGSDGTFALNWTQRNGDRTIGYLALGGTDLQAKVVQAQSPTSTGTLDVTGFGFDPDAIIVANIGYNAAPPSSDTASNCQMAIGAAIASAEWSYHTFSEDNVTTSNTARNAASIVADIGSDGSSSQDIATVSAWITDGVRLNFTTADATQRYFWVIGLKGATVKAGTFDTATSTGSATEVSSITGTPRAALMVSCMQATAAGWQTGSALTVGSVDDSGNEFSSGFTDEDAQTTTDSERFQSTTKAVRIYNQNGTLQTSGDASFSGSNLDVNYDTAAGTAFNYGYLVFSETPAAGGPAPHFIRRSNPMSGGFLT